jgi:thioester reductase-like protein
VVNSGPFEVVNALDFNQIEHLVEVHQITDVFNGALYRQQPKTQHLLGTCMNSLFHVLNLAKAGKIKKIFWPSSIAVLDQQQP